LRNIFTVKDRLDLSLEGYLFKPFEYIQEGIDQEAIENIDFTKVFLSGTVGLVYHSPVGPIALNFNYYDDDENQFGVLFHVGFLLFNKHALE
jgi:NTE family protein